ncbi:TPA: nucleotide pyrophosphohydrolase [Candidatus Bathyarchaeota archaeon]|nr:nucleotide pyrophosphohydrolase [Candidatus Bathyarchaeota archaeon]
MQIYEFQEMMKRLYFKRDKARGIEGNCDWLVDEIRELEEALKSNKREEAETEFADVLAWLASLANTVGVDLERAALGKYNNVCPKCGCCPCRCSF